MDYGWILAIVVIASLIKGITGFGFALVAMPPLLFWYSPQELVPVLTLCNLVVSVIIVLQKKERKLVSKSFQGLIVWGALFTILGVMALKYVPSHLLILLMAVFFMLLSVFTLFGGRMVFRMTQSAYVIAGSLCGFLTGSISISGPPLVLFLNYANVDNQQFREIFSWFSIVTAVIALVGYGFMGLLTGETLKMTLMVLPILYAGSFIGKRVNRFIPALVFKRVSIVLTILSCLLLLVNLK